jgi:hypothetical protein
MRPQQLCRPLSRMDSRPNQLIDSCTTLATSGDRRERTRFACQASPSPLRTPKIFLMCSGAFGSMLHVTLHVQPSTGHSIQPSVGGLPYPSRRCGLKRCPHCAQSSSPPGTDFVASDTLSLRSVNAYRIELCGARRGGRPLQRSVIQLTARAPIVHTSRLLVLDKTPENSRLDASLSKTLSAR